MENNCFANRKDGTCHALTEKQCNNCKFYKHKAKVKNNPFYEWSYKNKERFKNDKRSRKIPDEYIMKKED